MSTKQVLMLVEGEKVEPQLFEHFYQLYQKSNVKIVPYKTNLYALFHKLKKDYADHSGHIDFESIDLPLFLNDYFGFTDKDRLSKNDFQDILLVFDFDPQDPRYSRNKLMELLNGFSDSTEIGKLYINYPMIESFKDITSIVDGSFMDSTVAWSEIQSNNRRNRYKGIVNQRTCIPQLANIDRAMGKKVIDLHHKKVENIIPVGTIPEQKYKKLCEMQCDKLGSEQQVWIINTSLIYLFEEYGAIE